MRAPPRVTSRRSWPLPTTRSAPRLQDRLYAMSPRQHRPGDLRARRAGADRYEAARAVLDGWLAAGMWARESRAGHLSLPPDVYRGRTARDPPGIRRAGGGERLRPGRGAAARAHARGTQARPAWSCWRRPARTSACSSCWSGIRAASFCARRSRAASRSREARDLRGELHQSVAHHRCGGGRPRAGAHGAAAGHHRRRPPSLRDGGRVRANAIRRRARSSWPSSPWRRRGSRSFPTIAWSTVFRDFRSHDSAPMRDPWFDVSPLDDPLRACGPTNRRLGVVSGRSRRRVRPARRRRMERIAWPAGTSAAWRALAVSILHEGLLRPLLGITDACSTRGRTSTTRRTRPRPLQLAREGRTRRRSYRPHDSGRAAGRRAGRGGAPAEVHALLPQAAGRPGRSTGSAETRE